MKAYKFYSDPNRPVSDGESGKLMFKFDDKGEYITLDPILAKRMTPHFKNKEIELVEAKKPEEVQEEPKEEIKLKKCKKCDFETENQGELMRHYKEVHPKEG